MDLEKQEEKTEKMNIFSVRNALIFAIVLIIVGLGYVFKDVFVAATINGDVISRLEVVRQLEKTAGKNTLDTLITEKLIATAAAIKGVMVPVEEIESQVKSVEEQITAQGNTLAAALIAEGMSMEDFRGRILLQKQLEKLIADKMTVSDSDIDKYIADNQIEIPEGQESFYREQVKNQLESQKFGQEAQKFIEELKTEANIKYFVNY